MQLNDIKGLGKKRIEALNRAGINSPIDILMRFPFMYYDSSKKVSLTEVKDEEKVLLQATFIDKPKLLRLKNRLILIKGKIDFDGDEINVVWFNQQYIASAYKAGDSRLFYGKIKKRGRAAELINPQIIPLSGEKIVPIYKLPRGISQKLMRECVLAVLKGVTINGYFPDSLNKSLGLMKTDQAFREVHRPSSLSLAKEAARSIMLEKLTCMIAVYRHEKGDSSDRLLSYIDCKDRFNEARLSLPFNLTNSQEKAISFIDERLHSNKRLNLLIEGDVGSGKTIVAFFAAYEAVLSGYQACIMIPTEILAHQHFVNAKNFFSEKGIPVIMLLGSTPKAERAEAVRLIGEGTPCLIIGTQTLLNEALVIPKLALTIIDEQQRFGVCQRGSLENKATSVDNIVLTATPIPRTLALTLYGELESIKLTEKPAGASNVVTSIVPTSKLDDMYSYIVNKSRQGEKTYIVCPRIDDDEEVSALSLYEELSIGKMKGEKIGLLHGRMSEKAKALVMNAFASSNLNILVSTTVVEVGMDVKDATTMVIFGAERFGLSQLHQLRGRVGRDGRKAYCFLVSDTSNDRLSALKEINDGFMLAEKDFELRGAGDFLGTRQHGDTGEIFGIKVDKTMIESALALSNSIEKEVLFANMKNQEFVDSDFIRSLSLN